MKALHHPIRTPAPFGRRTHSVPVTVVADPAELAGVTGQAGTAVLRLEPPLHRHEGGSACVACETRGDIRVMLFELEEKQRRGMVPPFERVVVDATARSDAARVADAIVPGRLPALGLRDHAVARNFHLDRVL